MGKGRIKPVEEKQHGLHVDRFWPGQMHSVWKTGPLELRRERVYRDPYNKRLKMESWQFSFVSENHRIGFKWERDVSV